MPAVTGFVTSWLSAFYVPCVQLKGNQGDMQADVRAFIDDQEIDYIDEYISTNVDHGRIEERSYRVYSTTQYLDDTRKWPGLKAFVHVISTREMGGKSSRCERVCLMPKRPQAQESATIIQGHWAIENSLHWSLDIIMNDDRYRAQP